MLSSFEKSGSVGEGMRALEDGGIERAECCLQKVRGGARNNRISPILSDSHAAETSQ